MPVTLLTGMSGTGKTSVLEELQRRGYPCIDTDYDGWCVQVDDELIWDADRMHAFLASVGSEQVLVSGCVSNQGEFAFARVVLLSAPKEVILARVEARAGNPYGSSPAQKAEISANLRAIEPLMRASCDLELDATRPITELADAIEHLVAAPTG